MRPLVVDQRTLQDRFDLLGHGLEGGGDFGRPFVFGLFQGLLEHLALVFRQAHAAREFLRVDHDAFHARGDFERIVLHVFAGPAEDGVQQFFFRRQLGLALGRDLADQDVARPDVGADADDAVFVEVAQGLFADVGNVAGELLAAQLRLADFDVELLDVDRGVDVVLHQLLADDDGILEVVAVPGHEADQHVAAQGQLALEGGGSVGDRLSLFDFLADLDDRLLVLAGPLVEADELAQLIGVAADLDPRGVDVGHRSLAAGADDHARVVGHVALHARGHHRGLGHQQRHGLPLHVGTHQGAVGVVVFQERNQAGRNADHLARRHVDVLHPVDRHQFEVGMVAGDDRIALQLAVFDRGVGGSEIGLALFIGPQPDDVVGQLAAVHLAIGSDQKAVFVDGRIDRQAGDQTDVGPFRRFDRADATVVRNVHVADFEPGPLAVQTAGAQGRQAAFVGQHRERIGLVDDLRQLAAAEEVFDGRRDALGIDQAAGRHVLDVLQAHPLLDGAAELQEALAQLVCGQFVDRPQTAVAQVIDIVDLGPRLAAGQLEQIGHGGDQVFRPERHFVFGHFKLSLRLMRKRPTLPNR